MASIKIQNLKELSAADRDRIIGRAAAASDSVTIEQQVAAIIASVRKGGDAALRRYTAEFDGVELDSLAVVRAEVEAAYAQVDEALVAALKQAIRNITKFHEAQRANLDTPTVVTQPGVAIWRLWRGFDRVGLYVPGGKAIYPSSVLMNGIPARVAGCRDIVLCAPPAPNGSLPAPTLVAADLLGISRIFKVGGAQAIAAMAYGTESVPRVNKIYGAGNRYVTAAKMQVWGQVAIDMPAGPTEVMIIADASANPAWVAADLLAQAEHGEDSACLLLTDDTNLARDVAAAVEQQLEELATGQRAGVSIARYGAILIVTDLRQALDFANEYAPEHLEMITAQNDALLPLVRNVGSVFLGPYSPEPTGDYASGSNHVLPTSGYASMFGPLEVAAFGRAIQVQEITAEGLANLRETVERLATAEGLPGHRNAVAIRFKLGGELMNPETLIRADLYRSDYHPPLTPQDIAARYDLDPTSILKLDSGENPFGPSRGVRTALGEVDPTWYPDPTYQNLRDALGGYVGLPAACIAVSNGADEALDLLIRLCVGAGEVVLDCPPTFPMYATIARMRGGQVISVPRLADFNLDIPNILAVVERDPAIKIIFACSPNNPTGTVATWPEISALLNTDRLVVVDETYIEFQGRECSLAPLVADIPNLVVVRTFSKWAALAGLRLGFACADPRIAATLMQIKAPYNVNRAAEAAVHASLADIPDLDASVSTIVAERSHLLKALAHFPFLRPFPSAANFIYAETDGPTIYEALLRQGIMVRYFSASDARPAAIRITIGTPEQNERVLAAMAGMKV